MLSRQHVNGLLSLALSALPVLPLGGLSAFQLEVVKYSLMYVNEIHNWNKQPLSFFLHCLTLPLCIFFLQPIPVLHLSLSLSLSISPSEIN